LFIDSSRRLRDKNGTVTAPEALILEGLEDHPSINTMLE
jgi:hypothetical protein